MKRITHAKRGALITETQGNIQVNIKQSVAAANAETIKFGERFEVPPRFQKLKETGHIVSPEKSREIDFEFSTEDNSQSQKQDFIAQQISNIRKESDSKPPATYVGPKHREVTKDYKSAINLYTQHHKYSKPTYEPLPLGIYGSAGYVCTVTVNNTKYGSLDPYKTKKEAEHAAAQNACHGLGINPGRLQDLSPNKKSSPPRRTDGELKKRILWILEKKPNGLWNSRLTFEYKTEFQEDLPPNIDEMLLDWEDSITVDEVEGTDRKILYPKLPGSIKLTQSKVSSGVVSSVVLPRVGFKVTGYVCFVKTPSEFYVHRASDTGKIETIEQQIKEIYDSRGGPKSVLGAEPGMFCVAKYQEFWYRAKVINVANDRSDKCDVFFVDYGNYETVQGHLVRRILDNLCDLPAQALRCSLADVYPLNETWGKKDHEKFIDIYDFNQEIQLETVSVEDNCCIVKLYGSNDTTKSLNEKYVELGYARNISLPPEPDAITLPDENNYWVLTMSYIESTTKVIVRLYGDKYSKRLEELEEEKLPKLEKLTFGSASEVTPDCVCAAKILEDTEVRWYRVRVISVTENIAEVYYLDHGDSDKITLDNLRPLSLELNQLPYQAIPCKLTGLESFQNDKKVLTALEEYLFESICAQVDERHNQISLTLWDTNNETDVNINEKVSTVLTIEDLKPKLPMEGDTVDGYVSHVTEQGDIFFNVHGPGLAKLEEMCDELKAIYSKPTSSLFLPKPEKNMACVAKYIDDEEEWWYRSLIKAVYPKQRKARVFYIDYGNEETVLLSSLRALCPDSKYLKTLPMQAVRCSLYGLPPEGTEFTDDVIQRIKELCPNNELRQLEMVKKLAEGLPKVEIYEMSTGEELIGLSEKLMDENVFKPLEDSESEEEIEPPKVTNIKTEATTTSIGYNSKQIKQEFEASDSYSNVQAGLQSNREHSNMQIKEELDSSMKQLHIDVSIAQSYNNNKNNAHQNTAIYTQPKRESSSHPSIITKSSPSPIKSSVTFQAQSQSLYLPCTPPESSPLCSDRNKYSTKAPMSPDDLPYLPLSPDRTVIGYKDMLVGYEQEVEEVLQTSGPTTPKTPKSPNSPLSLFGRISPKPSLSKVGKSYEDPVLSNVKKSPSLYIAPTPNKTINVISSHEDSILPRVTVSSSAYTAPTPHNTTSNIVTSHEESILPPVTVSPRSYVAPTPNNGTNISSTSIMQGSSTVLTTSLDKRPLSAMDAHSQSYDASTISMMSYDKHTTVGSPMSITNASMNTTGGQMVVSGAGEGSHVEEELYEGQVLTIETGGDSGDVMNNNNKKRFVAPSKLYEGVLDPIIDMDEIDSEDEEANSNNNSNSSITDEGFNNKAETVAFLQEATMVMGPDYLNASGMSVEEEPEDDLNPDNLTLPLAQPLPTSGDKVYITMVENPTDFRCVPQVNMEELSNMMESMFLYYSSKSEQPRYQFTADTAVEGEVYAGLHEELWYRVVIKKVVHNQAAIHFVDYGDYIVLPVSELRLLPAQFRKFPFQAIKAKLAGLHHPGNNWSKEACTRMQQLVQEQLMTAWIHGMEGDFLSITLVDTESTTNAFIHKILLSEGYAVKNDANAVSSPF